MTVSWTGSSECYNKRHAVHICAGGDMVSIDIPREDRVKTKSYCKTTAGAPPTINQVSMVYPHPLGKQTPCRF